MARVLGLAGRRRPCLREDVRVGLLLDGCALDGGTGQKGPSVALTEPRLSCLFRPSHLQAGAESPDLDVLWPLRMFSYEWPVCPLREPLGGGGTFTPEPV